MRSNSSIFFACWGRDETPSSNFGSASSRGSIMQNNSCGVNYARFLGTVGGSGR